MWSKTSGLLAVALVAACSGAFAQTFDSGIASAQTEDVSDDSVWVHEDVPSSAISVTFPAGWVDGPVSDIQARVGKPLIKVLLAVGDPADGNRANILVNRWTGRKASWYGDLDTYKAEIGQGAAKSKGKVLAAGMKRVGRALAYWSVEREMDAQLGEPVLYGDLQIRENKHSVVTVFVTVTADRPHARRIVENVLHDVSTQRTR